MGTKMQVLGGKIKFLSYKLSTQFGLVAQLVRATDCLYSGNANMWYERHPYKMEIVGSTPTTATMKKAILVINKSIWRSQVQALAGPQCNALVV